MTFWAILSAALFLLWFLDALRLRGRARSLLLLKDSVKGVNPQYRFIARAGAIIDEATRRAASAYATTEGLQVLVLLPQALPAPEALLCVQTFDSRSFRNNRMARARFVGEGLLVHEDVLKRMGVTIQEPADAVAFAKLADEFKKYASTKTDLVLAPRLQVSRKVFRLDLSLLSFIFGPFANPIVLLQMVLLVCGMIYAPALGLAALAMYLVQPLFVFAGSRFRVRGLLPFALLRPLLDAVGAIRSLLFDQSQSNQAQIQEKRSTYSTLLAKGTERFFEAPRRDCPLCGSEQLMHAVTSTDRVQFKPGVFIIDRCRDCAHLFQNPRLSLDGLDFYYKDFYDGLGAEQVETVFTTSSSPYLARAKMLKGAATPSRWLDVGAGHGHFCSLAREVWPDVAFDAIDLSSSVEKAESRGWADRSYRGLFPELADSLAKDSAYDVISMSHYLEHTRDPEAEIEAAAKVLHKGGHLLIELPDPDCRLARILGSFWLPWFQPQHQHMLSTKNLQKMLKTHAFEPIRWHRGEAHQASDFFFLLLLCLNRLAPPADVPWVSTSSFLRRAWRNLVFLGSVPFMIAARVIDLATAPMFRRPGWSNTYRVLARRTA